MSPELFAIAKPYFTRFEGSVNHMYQCAHGGVTVGVGHLIPSEKHAERLLWVFRPGMSNPPGTFAGAFDIRREFRTIKKLPFGNAYAASYYAPHTRLILEQKTIDRILELDILEADRLLAARFPNAYDLWPVKIQLAMVDMMFSIGPAFLGKTPPKAYPKLVEAAEKGDWCACARESKRGGVSKERDEALEELFRSECVK